MQLTATHVVPTSLLLNGDSFLFPVDTIFTNAGDYTFTTLSSLPILVEKLVTTATQKTISSSMVKIFPNPANDFITLIADRKERENLKIFNLFGQELNSMVYIPSETESSCLIGIGNLPSGMYILKTKTAADIVYKK